MNKPCTFLLSALMASAVLAPAAASAADKSELEVRMEAAQKVLADRSYYERWSPEAALKTVEDAKAANEAGSARQKEIDGALDVMKDWCHTRLHLVDCHHFRTAAGPALQGLSDSISNQDFTRASPDEQAVHFSSFRSDGVRRAGACRRFGRRQVRA